MKHIKIFDEHRYWVPGTYIYIKSFYINKDNTNYFYNIVKYLEDNNLEYKLFYIVGPSELTFVKIQVFTEDEKQENDLESSFSFLRCDKEEEKIRNEKWTEMNSKKDIDMILNSKKYNL